MADPVRSGTKSLDEVRRSLAALQRKLNALDINQSKSLSSKALSDYKDPDEQVVRFDRSINKIQGSLVRIDDDGLITGSPTLVRMRLGLSAGIISGGAITDNSDGTIDVALGSGYFRPTNDSVDDIEFLTWSTTTNLTVTIDSTRYVGILYNGGSPVVEVHATNDFDGQTGFEIAVLVNEDDSVVHITTHEPHSGDIARVFSEFFHAAFHIMRISGLILGETGTRNITLTAGVIAVAEDLFDFAELNTSGDDRFDAYYGDFTKVSGLSQWPNEQYDLNGTLTNMTNNRYGNLWFYAEPDGELAMIYGTAQYVTASQAEAASPPSSVPARILEHGVIIAQLVYQKGETTTNILNPFVTQFNAAGVTTHNDLTDNGGTDSHVTIQSHMDDGDIHIKHNVAAGAPGVNDDSDSGYSLGSHWVRSATQQVWICKSAAVGAAVWDQISFAFNAFGQSADPTVNNDNTQGLHAGSIWTNTTASPDRVFILKDPATGAADWIEIVDNYTHPDHTGDVTSSGDGATAIAAGVIVNADVKSDAAIALTKLATGTERQVLGVTGTPANKMHTRLISHVAEFDIPVEGDRRVLGRIGSASTMFEIHGSTNAGTVVFNVQIVTRAQLQANTGTDILTSDESATFGSGAVFDVTDMDNSGALAADNYLVVVLGVVTSATRCWISSDHEIDVPA